MGVLTEVLLVLYFTHENMMHVQLNVLRFEMVSFRKYNLSSEGNLNLA